MPLRESSVFPQFSISISPTDRPHCSCRKCCSLCLEGRKEWISTGNSSSSPQEASMPTWCIYSPKWRKFQSIWTMASPDFTHHFYISQLLLHNETPENEWNSSKFSPWQKIKTPFVWRNAGLPNSCCLELSRHHQTPDIIDIHHFCFYLDNTPLILIFNPSTSAPFSQDYIPFLTYTRTIDFGSWLNQWKQKE